MDAIVRLRVTVTELGALSRTVVVKRIACVILAAGLCAIGIQARANTSVYTYAVEDPSYGDIGSYTNTIERSGDRTHVETTLHVAIRLLGFVPVFTLDARRSEDWRMGRLISFNGATTTNGKTVYVSGQARDDTFVITSPAGVTVAPASVYPSNAWSPGILKAKLIMSTKTGEVENVHITAGTKTTFTLSGRTLAVRRYMINGRKPGILWFDSRGVAIAFQVWERGRPIKFVLVSRPTPSGADASCRLCLINQ
jgi:Domain of unknown function (DUF6134)